MKPKVLLAAGLYPPDVGGPATYAKMVTEELPERGIDVAVVSFGTVRNLPRLLRHFLYALKLWRASADVKAIYALDPISVGLPSLLVARLRRLPFVVRLGGDYAWEQGRLRFGVISTLDKYTKNRQVAGVRTRFLAYLQDYVVKRAKLIIVPSQYLRSVVTSWPGLDENRVLVIKSALFPIEVNGTKEELRTKLSYNGFTMVTAGRLVPWKGIDKLLDVVDQVPDSTLVIAGSGPEMERLKKHARSLGIDNRVRFLGNLNKEALGEIVKAADVFLLNTGYEGLSHQLLEVMELEVPVVTTNAGGNVELIENNVNGLLVAHNDVAGFSDAVLKLKDDTILRERLVKNAKSSLSDFDRGKSLDALKEALVKLF